jgi:hypothetical protein
MSFARVRDGSRVAVDDRGRKKRERSVRAVEEKRTVPSPFFSPFLAKTKRPLAEVRAIVIQGGRKQSATVEKTD